MKIYVRCFLIVLCLYGATSVYAEEICIIDRPPIVERIENRSYPSVFGAWSHELLNYPRPDDIYEWSYYKEMLTRNDLYWGGANLGIQWRLLTPEGVKLVAVGSTGALQFVKDSRRGQLQSLNPNYLHLISVYYYGTNPLAYPEDWPYWLRDKQGNRVQDEGWSELLIDWTHPGAQDHFVQQAVAAAKCGIFDGIFMDWWDESKQWDQEMADLYHGSKVDGLVSLVKRIREAVGDDFLIIVNTNTRKIPRSAPYVNGAFMETIGHVQGYAREHLIEIEDALLWYEESFRYPQVNCLEGWGIPSESLDSPRNQQQARVFTTLSLTHSNGYVSYTTGIRIGGNHEHAYEIWKGHSQEHASGEPGDHTHQKYWYRFYDAPLGRPVGGDETKGVLYKTPKGVSIEGLFIREFTNGWAVYNRSGKERKIYLPEKVSGVASGVENKHWHTIPDLDGEIFLKKTTAPVNEIKKTTAPADVNNDGKVNIDDIRLVVAAIGVEPTTTTRADVNEDGTVNVVDLQIVIDNLDNPTTAEAPTLRDDLSGTFNAALLRAELHRLGTDTQQLTEAIALLKYLLASTLPEQTRLLANYPNPFNPETWIPYHLANPSNVAITIYDTHGSVIRQLNLGHQREGYYTSRSRAAYWDGRNDVGEHVASGVYFYQLQAENLSLLRKMLILK